jgi:hypothetical protein
VVYRLVYVSRCLLAPTEVEKLAQSIIEFAGDHSEREGVTGQLVYAGDYFAEALEGDKAVIEEIIAHIAGHPSHHDITIIEQGEVAERMFETYSLGHWRQSTFVADVIAQARADGQAWKILRLMTEWQRSARADG